MYLYFKHTVCKKRNTESQNIHDHELAGSSVLSEVEVLHEQGASWLIATQWNRIERIIRVSLLGPEAMGDTKGVWDLFKLVLSKTAQPPPPPPLQYF